VAARFDGHVTGPTSFDGHVVEVCTLFLYFCIFPERALSLSRVTTERENSERFGGGGSDWSILGLLGEFSVDSTRAFVVYISNHFLRKCSFFLFPAVLFVVAWGRPDVFSSLLFTKGSFRWFWRPPLSLLSFVRMLLLLLLLFLWSHF